MYCNYCDKLIFIKDHFYCDNCGKYFCENCIDNLLTCEKCYKYFCDTCIKHVCKK